MPEKLSFEEFKAYRVALPKTRSKVRDLYEAYSIGFDNVMKAFNQQLRHINYLNFKLRVAERNQEKLCNENFDLKLRVKKND